MSHLQLVQPRAPQRSIEVSPDDLEAIAFDTGAEITRPEGAGWRRLTADGQRYHAWQNAAGTEVPA